MLRSLRRPFHSSCFFSSFFWWYISRIGTCYAITYGVLLKVHHTFVFFMLNYQPSHFFGILSKSYTSLFYFNFKIQFSHLGIPWSHVWDGGWGEPRPRPGQNQNLKNVFPVTLEEITQKIPSKKISRMDVDIAWCGSNRKWMNNQFMWFAIGKNEAQGNQIDWIHMSHL